MSENWTNFVIFKSDKIPPKNIFLKLDKISHKKYEENMSGKLCPPYTKWAHVGCFTKPNILLKCATPHMLCTEST